MKGINLFKGLLFSIKNKNRINVCWALTIYPFWRLYICKHSNPQKWPPWDFRGGPVVKTAISTGWDVVSIPGQGNKIPHALWWVERKKESKRVKEVLNSSQIHLHSWFPQQNPLVCFPVSSTLCSLAQNTSPDLRWCRKKSQRSGVFLFQVTFAASQKLPRFSMP